MHCNDQLYTILTSLSAQKRLTDTITLLNSNPDWPEAINITQYILYISTVPAAMANQGFVYFY